MKKLLVFMCGVALLMGCGSSSSSGGGGGIPTEGKVMLEDVSSTVTRVFVDINENNQFDTGEPEADEITAENGYYTYSINISDSSKPLKAEVSGLARSSKSYILSTPAGQTLISPYTTMVHNIMVSEGKTVADAQNVVNISTGRSDNFFSESTYEDEKVQKTAQYIANSIKNAVNSTSVAGLSSEDLNSIIIAVTNAVMEALQDVLASINNDTFDENDKFDADLDALGQLAQGMFIFDYYTQSGSLVELQIQGIKLVNGVWSSSWVTIDEYKNGSHIYNNNIDLAKMVYDPWGAVTLEADGSLTIHFTQKKIMNNLTSSTPSNAQIYAIVDMEHYSYSDFPRLNKTVIFSGNAQAVSFDWTHVAVDLDNPDVRNTLDLDNSTDKDVELDHPICGVSKTEDIYTAYNNGTCSTSANSWSLYEIGGKARIAKHYISEGRTDVVWIENGLTYAVHFNHAGTDVIRLYNKVGMEQILQAYFSE